MTDVSDSFEPIEPREPTPKKRSPLLWVLGIVVAVALLAGGAAIGAGKDDVSDDPLELLSAAPDAVRDEGSARISMSMSMGGDAMSMDIEGDGAVDFETGAATFAISALGFDINVLTDGETVWFQLPMGGIDGKSWIAAPADAMQGSDMVGVDSATGVLDGLRGVGAEIDDLGTEEINGVDAQHYSAMIDLADAIAAAPESERDDLAAALDELGALGDAGFPVDVWITDDGLPVRMVMTFDPAGDVGGGLMDDAAFRMQIDLTDFGEPVEIDPPDPSDVHVIDDPSELEGLFGGGGPTGLADEYPID